MVEWHMKDTKKVSGGKRASANALSKKLAWKGGTAAHTKTDSTVKKDNVEVNKGMGNTTKSRALETKKANVTDNKGKVFQAEIIAVKVNDANRLFARSNVSTKGAVIRVKVGDAEKLARVTNRPGQDGNVNATLIE